MPITREQILAAAADLLVGGGREAVSTRAVCTAAGIQAPTLYRLFGDKEGLLDARRRSSATARTSSPTCAGPGTCTSTSACPSPPSTA